MSSDLICFLVGIAFTLFFEFLIKWEMRIERRDAIEFYEGCNEDAYKE